MARNFLDKANRFRLLTIPPQIESVYSRVNHVAVAEAVRYGDPQTALEMHCAPKGRWGRELSDLLERLDLFP